jgi:hypothetical protein
MYTASQAIQAGKVKPMAVTSAKRMPRYPNIPTMQETYPGFVEDEWWVVLAPAGTPSLSSTSSTPRFTRIFSLPEVKEKIAKLDIEFIGGSPEDALTYMQSKSVEVGQGAAASRHQAGMSVGQLPLAGVLVAELGDRIGASACASVLAQLGATVVVVETSSISPAANSSSKWRRRASALAGKLSLVSIPVIRRMSLRASAAGAADVVVCSSDFGSATGH